MNENNILLAKILTYLGTAPLIGSIILFFIPLPLINEIDPSFFALTYSAAIISFLCGIHWAIYLFFSARCSQNLLIISNFITLISWFCLILSPKEVCLFIQSLCFLYLLIIDTKLYKEEILPKWFYYLRRNATLIVTITLLVISMFELFFKYEIN